MFQGASYNFIVLESPWNPEVIIGQIGQQANSFETPICWVVVNGGARRDRTDDLLHAMQALSQLSYGPNCFNVNC